MSLTPELSLLQVGSGPESEAVLGTLEKQLICPICLEIFNKPVVILPCQHNLCRKCANELYQPSLFQARTTMMVNSGRFRCPSCRQEVVLDRHGVYGLQRNLLVENIIDFYKRQISNMSNMSNMSNAAGAPPPPAEPPAEVTCSDHDGEKLNIYCLSCQRPTCSLCKVFGAHQSCTVSPLTDVYQQQKDELSEGVDSLMTVNDKVQASISELEETCRTIEANCQTQKQSLCEKFHRMSAVLVARQKAMNQQISSEQEEKAGHAQSLARCYGDSVEANSKLLERAMSSMEETDMAAFIQSSKDLIAKVTAATASCPTVTLKPGYENMSRYRFDFSQQQRALQSIDFIKQDLPEEPLEEPQKEPQPEEPKEPSIQNLETKHLEEPSIQNLQSDHLQEPSVQDLQSNHLQEPSVQNLEPIRLQKLSIQNMEPQHLQETSAQNLEPNHFQEPSVQNLKPSHLQKVCLQNLEPQHLQEPSVQNLEPSHLQKVCLQNLEPQHLQEPSVQNLETVMEPVKELVPVPLFPPVEPVQSPAAAAVGLVKDCEEPAEEDLQPEDEGGLMKDEQEEREKPQAEEVRGGCDPGKEGNRGERQEGMSTLQREGSETIDDAADWTSHIEITEKQVTQDGAEEMDVMFYPSWYKPSSQCRVNPGLASPTKPLPDVHDPKASICSPSKDSTTDATTGTRNQTGAPGAVQIQPQHQLLQHQQCPSATETQIQFHPSVIPTSKPFSLDEKMSNSDWPPQEHSSQFVTQPPRQSGSLNQPPPCPDCTSQLQKKPIGPGSSLNPLPPVQVAQQTAGSEENEEEVDMQGWVCLPGAADKSLVEGSFDLGEGSLDHFLETSTALDGEGRILNPNDASELNDSNSALVGKNCETETMKEETDKQSPEADERNEELVKDFSEFGGAAENHSSTEDDSSKVEGCAAGSRENTNGFMCGVKDGEFETHVEDKQEAVERTEDTEPKVETSASEAEVKITPLVSVQTVTLIFYLMAFLVILQRVWPYIGCFICT